MKAKLENNELSIQISLDDLAEVTKLSPALDWLLWDNKTNTWKEVRIVDKFLWAKEVISELNRECEDGTTLIHIMLDKAIINAVEAGARGIHIDGIPD